MSSLRLALKQSLQDSGVGTSSDRRRKKGRRRKMYSVADDNEADEDAPNSNNRNDKQEKTDGNVSDSSEENEFSVADEDEDDDDNSEDEEGSDEDSNDDEEEDEEGDNDSSSSSRSRPRQGRKSPVPQHDEQHKQRHSAAHKIQSHWKHKQESKPPEDEQEESVENEYQDDNDQRNPLSEEGNSERNPKTKESRDRNSSEQKSVSRNKQKQTGDKKAITKSMTVPPPSSAIMEFMHNMPVKRCRRSIVPGLRVKVRFLTKVVVKRRDPDANPDDPDNAPLKKQVVKKKTWFGGRVSAVSKEGSKIRIKYDDGTSEVTKFPDKDIVVDDTDNGQHQVSADKFIPPPPSPQSPPIGVRTADRIDPTASDLVDTPMQKETVDVDVKNLDLNKAPPIVFTQSQEQEQNGLNDKGMAPPDAKPMRNPERDPSKERERDRPDKAKEPFQNSEEQVQTTSKATASTERDDAASPPSTKQELLSSTTGQDDKPTSTGNRIQISAAPIPSSSGNSPRDENGDESVSQKPKKKRGRPPKHRPTSSQESSPDGSFKQTISQSRTEKILEAAEGKLVSSAEKEGEERKQKPSLKIRISYNRAEGEKSPRPNQASALSNSADGEGEHVGARTEGKRLKKKRSRDEIDSSDHSDDQPAKKLHIHIPSQQMPPDDKIEIKALTQQTETNGRSEMENSTISPKRSQKKGVVVGEDIKSKIGSPPASPRGRKKRRKMAAAAAAAAAAASMDEKGSKILDHSSDGAASKYIKIRRASPNHGEDDDGKVEFQSEDEPGSPTGRSKKDSQDAPAVRSGRRAAQQANERIVSKQESVIPDPTTKETSTKDLSAKKEKKRKRREGELGEFIEDPLEDSQWVQCDACKKWRIIPSSVVDSLPNQWYCKDNKYDPKRATCEAPEQTAKQAAKERKRKLKRQQRLMMKRAAAAESAESLNQSKPDPNEVKDQPKDKLERVRSPVAIQREENATDPKSSKRASSDNGTHSESGSDSQDNSKLERKIAKKGKSPPPSEKPPALDNNGEVIVKRPRGRPRRNQGKEAQSSSGSNNDGSKIDDDNLEWVQCEKCDKWRRLPSHISADDLPDQWYCEMNTWSPDAASCDVPEDKADGMQDVSAPNNGPMFGKLTYRNLIFGSNGRKQNRAITEKLRASESLFSVHHEEEDIPSKVLYANSSAFVSRARPNLLSDDNENQGVLHLMSNSHLWKELFNATAPPHTEPGILGQYGKEILYSSYTFDTLPDDVRQPMKDMVLYFLGEATLLGEEVFQHGQMVTVDKLSSDFEKARPYWNVNVVVTTLAELVKDGSVECVQKRKAGETTWSFDPHYRQRIPSSSRSTISAESSESHRNSRCMKIAKPWKRARLDC